MQLRNRWVLRLLRHEADALCCRCARLPPRMLQQELHLQHKRPAIAYHAASGGCRPLQEPLPDSLLASVSW